eukprot:CAMPEP_0206530730 /NCGR_PEP_ID=MMETSP0325_2-20121206/3342_1 /ASSEMBLY_ACC=CAM_ASM_000347 /TAXON_ID=2866 /ORGANISM="Crypthecodinium cohnii, Strain Seligo" /LENGTH=86 /DNA_ID=CAMNT_0054026835 /DNA_START=113 /DNA_END=371 /DNA_ORIENTATION=+
MAHPLASWLRTSAAYSKQQGRPFADTRPRFWDEYLSKAGRPSAFLAVLGQARVKQLSLDRLGGVQAELRAIGGPGRCPLVWMYGSG